jgi:hypothetical protein
MPQSNLGWHPNSVGIALAAYQPNPVWLAEQLASFTTQTHTEWICMITLDSPLQELGSVSDLRPFMRDERFIWVENSERLGLRSNFQKATQLLLGRGVDLIAFCDQDDIWLPEKLAESVAAMRSHGPLSMVYCDAYIFVDGVKRSERLHEYTIKTDGEMSIAERIIQPQVSGFCEVFDASLARLHPTIPAESPDHDHWYSLVATAYGGVHRINKPLALYRQHEGNTIGISAVRLAQGWGATTQLARYSTLRENARLRADIARSVGRELPMPRGLGLLYRHSGGWLIILLGVMGRRLFSDRRLASNAYRKACGLFFPEVSKREFIQQVRKRLPAQFKILRTMFTIVAVLVALLIVLAAQVGSVSETTIATAAFTCLFVVSQVITGLRCLQHQMPLTPVLLAGIGAFGGLLSQLLGASVWLAVATAAVPIIANGLYRLRWALRP